MDIFNSISEIQISNKYIDEAQKQFDSIITSPSYQSSKSIKKSIEPVFAQKVQDLKQKLIDEVDIITGMIETIEDQQLIPQSISVSELIGEQMDTMPEWFGTAIQKQLEKHRNGLNVAIRKMFRSMFTENEKQSLKKDLLNTQVIVKRMLEFDKTKLSNSQMIQLMSLVGRFDQSRSKYTRFLNDCAKRVLEFIKQNQQKAVSFTSSNKVYVEDMRSPEQWANYTFPQFRQNIIPNAQSYYHTSSLSYNRPSSSTAYPRMTAETSLLSQKNPASSMGYFRQQKLTRGMSPMTRDINIKEQLLKGARTDSYFNRQPPMRDSGRNFYYRQASSLSRPTNPNIIPPSYPINNLYRDFYY